MNHIGIEKLEVEPGFFETYWTIDGRPLTEYLDAYVFEGPLSWIDTTVGLLPAWGDRLDWKWESDAIWELLDSDAEANVPILLCDSDCDLSCLVIVAHIIKSADEVRWTRLGVINQGNYSFATEKQSGILHLESYSDEDWDTYGSNIALETSESRAYSDWISAHPYEEHIRRLRNYTIPYMQDDQNVDWIMDPDWRFDRGEYDAVVEAYRARACLPCESLNRG